METGLLQALQYRAEEDGDVMTEAEVLLLVNAGLSKLSNWTTEWSNEDDEFNTDADLYKWRDE